MIYDRMAMPHRRWSVPVALTATVAAGLLTVLLSYVAQFVAYLPTANDILNPSSTYTPDFLTSFATIDNMVNWAVVLFAAGAAIQAHRLVGIYGGSFGTFPRLRRVLDVVLTGLSALLLYPVFFDNAPSKWTDPTFYAYAGFGIALVWLSARCVTVMNRFGERQVTDASCQSVYPG